MTRVVVTLWVTSPEAMGKLSMSRSGQGLVLGRKGREWRVANQLSMKELVALESRRAKVSTSPLGKMRQISRIMWSSQSIRGAATLQGSAGDMEEGWLTGSPLPPPEPAENPQLWQRWPMGT